MTTVLQYLVIAAVIGLLLFAAALLLFGRGEQLAALPARTSPARLPERGIEGADVRRIRFALAVRGYRMSDVDWTLERLADELDRTRQQLAQVTGGSAADGTTSAHATPVATGAIAGTDPDGVAGHTDATPGAEDDGVTAEATVADAGSLDQGAADPVGAGDPVLRGDPVLHSGPVDETAPGRTPPASSSRTEPEA